MYADGRTWGYQVQSTGLANFQMETFLDNEKVLLPDLPEQAKIADLLSNLDQLIGANQRLVTDLRELRIALWDNTPMTAGASTFDAIATLKNDRATPSNVSAETVYLGLEHFGEDGVGISSMGEPSNLDSQKSRFDAGDVLYGKLRPYFRKVARPDFPGICSTEIWVLRPKGDISPEFLEWVAASQAFTDHAMAGSSGTRMPRAAWDHVGRFTVHLPSDVDMSSTAAATEVLWKQMWVLIAESRTLVGVRDELLPLLLSGRLRLEDVAA